MAKNDTGSGWYYTGTVQFLSVLSIGRMTVSYTHLDVYKRQLKQFRGVTVSIEKMLKDRTVVIVRSRFMDEKIKELKEKLQYIGTRDLLGWMGFIL